VSGQDPDRSSAKAPEAAGSSAWLYCWFAVTIFILIIQFLAPVIIMPLFNKFSPLAEGELKKRITDYANEQHFALKGIYTMDGSRRSTRLNAFLPALAASAGSFFLTPCWIS
jgi:STE24 endopeptidase